MNTETTWAMRDGSAFRELPDGKFRRLASFPAVSGEDWRRVCKEPIAANPVAEGIRKHFTGPALISDPLQKRAAPIGNAGGRGAGESLPFVAGSATSEACAVRMESHAETDRARILAYLQSCRYEGATDEEMQTALALGGSTQRPRRGELAKAGKVTDSLSTRPTKSGHAAVVWVAREYAPPAGQRGCRADSGEVGSRRSPR